MKSACIWNISEDITFPVPLWDYKMFTHEVRNLKLYQIESIDLDENEIHLVLLQLSLEQWQLHKEKILQAIDTHKVCQVVIITDKPVEFQDAIPHSNRFFVMSNPVHTNELKMILEKSLVSAYYKMIAFEIGESSMNNISFFEGIFELARKEKKDALDESKALHLLLEYEAKIKIFQDNLNLAFERLMDMKDSELHDMKQWIEATEKLDILREKELKEALHSMKAVEEVLQFSRMEEINLEKTIEAQNKLVEYTSMQIRELIEENKKLKEQLEKKSQ